MSNKLLYKIHLAFLVISLVMLAICAIHQQRFDSAQIIAFCAILCLYIGGKIAHIYKVFSAQLLQLYFDIIGPLQIGIAFSFPEVLTDRSDFFEIIRKNEIITEYCLVLLVSYFFMIVVTTVIEKTSLPSRRTKIQPINLYSLRFPVIICCVFAIIDYIIRKKYNIDIPGLNPLIPFAGIYVYLSEAFRYFVIFVTCYRTFIVSETNWKKIAKTIVISIIVQLPNIIIGIRSPVMTSFVLIAFFVFLSKYDNKFNFRQKKMSKGVVIVAVVFFGVLYGITNYMRFGEFTIIRNLLTRVTGITEGVRILNNIKTNELDFSIIDYVKALLFEQGITPNKYYTHYILHFPLTAVHSNAMPMIISCYFYNGYLGVTLISSFIFSIFALCTKGINKQKKIAQQIVTVYTSDDAGKLFCLCLLEINMLLLILDGDITHFRRLITPIITYFFIRFFTNRHISS